MGVLGVLQYPGISPIAFRIGPLAFRWYGIAYLVGFAASYFILGWLSDRWGLGLSIDDRLTIILGAMAGVIIGSRLGYVLVYGNGFYWTHPAQVLALWDGGMAWHGGLAGILIAGAILSRTMRIPFLTICDLGCVGAPIGFFLGRLANFVNDELWGRVTTVPWGMVFPGAGPLPRHPSQLYEAFLEGFVIFIVMLWLATRRPAPFRGTLLGWLLTLYGSFRILVEFFRQPDVQIGFLPGHVTMGQILSVPLVIAGVALLIWTRRTRLPQQGRA